MTHAGSSQVPLFILLGAIVQGRRVRHGHLELRTKITEDTRALHEALHKKSRVLWFHFSINYLCQKKSAIGKMAADRKNTGSSPAASAGGNS